MERGGEGVVLVVYLGGRGNVLVGVVKARDSFAPGHTTAHTLRLYFS